MTNTFKIGDKFLLPVEINLPSRRKAEVAYVKHGDVGERIFFDVYPDDLIPASTLTDLQAENARLRTALGGIKSILEQANHRDVLPEMIYQIAVKALGRDE